MSRSMVPRRLRSPTSSGSFAEDGSVRFCGEVREPGVPARDGTRAEIPGGSPLRARWAAKAPALSAPTVRSASLLDLVAIPMTPGPLSYIILHNQSRVVKFADTAGGDRVPVPMDHLKLDLTALTDSGVGTAGISGEHLARIAGRAGEAVDGVLARRAAQEVGFFDLPDDGDSARQAMEFARSLPPHIDTIVVLGIGGSSLGGHAVYSALARPLDALRSRSPGMPRRILFPDNVDPDTFSAILDLCPLERTVFNVVTKSGSTAETVAQLLVVADRLAKTLGADALPRHLVITTDPEQGPLRRLASEMELPSFPVPPSVGGRFSVLSAVGLVPAACAGVDVTGLLQGARDMRDRILAPETRNDVRQNPALMLAALLYLHHVERQRPMAVMMPYADGLYDAADWFRQLWAESLGKAVDLQGNEVNTGPTPIASRGATDQHSQLQLYAEGPDDKVFLFLSAAQPNSELRLPSGRMGDAPEYSYLCGHTMGELLAAELRGTRASLTRRGRPSASIELTRLDAPSLGAFFMLLEAATAFSGGLYGIDPFDQPGVEEAKRLAFAAFGRPGFEEHAAALEAVPAADSRYSF